MYDDYVNKFKLDLYLLGPYGYLIRDAIKKTGIVDNTKTKEALREQVRLPKIFYEQGWKRYSLYRELENKSIDISMLLNLLTSGFKMGSWSKEEAAAYDWEFIFSACDYGDDIIISSELVNKITLAIKGGELEIIINDKLILNGKGKKSRRIKGSETFRTIFEYKMDVEVESSRGAHRERKIVVGKAKLRYNEKYLDDWMAEDFVSYIHDRIVDKYGAAYMAKPELRKRGIFKNGVKAFGVMVKVKNAVDAKQKYKEFIDWLIDKSMFAKTLSTGNFVSRATFRIYLTEGKKKEQAGTVLKQENIDYGKDAEVTF